MYNYTLFIIINKTNYLINTIAEHNVEELSQLGVGYVVRDLMELPVVEPFELGVANKSGLWQIQICSDCQCGFYWVSSSGSQPINCVQP